MNTASDWQQNTGVCDGERARQEDGSSGPVCDMLGRGVEPQALDFTPMNDNISKKSTESLYEHKHTHTQWVEKEWDSV